LVLATLALSLGYWLYVRGGTDVQAQEIECPSPRLIEEVTGNGDQQSAPFNTTTSFIRLSFDVQADRPTVPFFVYVREADDPESPSVGDASAQGPANDEAFVNAPPGRYFLDIGTTDAQYTIRVEECGEGGRSQPRGGK
jgi:hypothetical protein